MKGLGPILLGALVAFPSFSVAVYGPCCTGEGGCQGGGATTRPCCKQKAPCCTPTILKVDNLVQSAVVAAPFAPDAPVAVDVALPCEPFTATSEPQAARRDPAHVPRPPTLLFLLNCSLLR